MWDKKFKVSKKKIKVSLKTIVTRKRDNAFELFEIHLKENLEDSSESQTELYNVLTLL